MKYSMRTSSMSPLKFGELAIRADHEVVVGHVNAANVAAWLARTPRPRTGHPIDVFVHTIRCQRRRSNSGRR